MEGTQLAWVEKVKPNTGRYDGTGADMMGQVTCEGLEWGQGEKCHWN